MVGNYNFRLAETNKDLLEWLIKEIASSIGLREGLKVPEGIQAREIAQGQRFYVNTTRNVVLVPLEKPGEGVLSGQQYQDALLLEPYDAELVLG